MPTAEPGDRIRRVTGRARLAVAALVLLSGGAASDGVSAQDAATRTGALGVDAPFELRYADEPRISGDGRTVAWVERFADRMTDRWGSRILLHETDLGRTRAITDDSRISRTPRFSPDGRQLAWASLTEGLWEIRALEIGSGRTRTIATITDPPYSLAWSPRGDHIAFMAHSDHPESVVRGLPSPPPGADWAPPPHVIEEVISQRDGEEFPEPGTMNLFVVGTTSGQPTRVTRPGFAPGAWKSGSPLSWTPDGSAIVLSANTDEDPWREPLDTEVVEVNIASGDVRRITSRYGPDDEPALSPDGRQIAHTGFDDRHQWYQTRELYVTDRSGVGGIRSLSGGFDGDVRSPVWSADGTAVYALMEQAGLTRLARFDLLGSFRIIADSLGTGSRAAVGSAAFDIARVADPARIVATITSGDSPGSVALGVGEAPLSIIDRGSEPAGDRLGTVESVTWLSSLDDREIAGWVVFPPDFDNTRTYPLIVEVHGGRGSNHGPRFDVEKQVLAAAGYIVLYPNYRGSSGYGAEFGNLLHRSFPGDEYHDLLSGADALIERGWVDPDRLFIVGGGAGGTIAAWTTAHTDRFKAAVIWYPAIDLDTYWFTVGASPSMLRYQREALPWEDPGEYDARSPLSVVDRVTTPTLLVAGDEDYVTPVQESIAYFRALRMVGVESSLVRVPGAGHGIRNRPSQQMAKLQATLNWIRYFDRRDSP